MERKNYAWFAMIILAFIPVIIWIFMIPINLRFGDFNSSFRSLGQITGLIGMTLFSITLFLSTRLKFIENIFEGLDKAYYAHHLLGTFSFILLIFHPVFLSLRYILISLNLAATSILLTNNFAVNFGIFSLVSMILFLMFTFIIRIPYHYWKITHQLLGISYLFAIIHVFFIRSDLTSNIFLRVYIFFFIILGLASYIYRILLAHVLVNKKKYKIKSIKNIHETVLEVVLEPDNIKEKIISCPGQFIYISFRQKGISKEYHPFTISSGKELRLAIKSLGDFTFKLKDLKPGTEALIEGPYGKFCPSNFSKGQVWIAGGIGITPFMSMAKNLEKNNFSVDLFYSVKEKNDAIFLEELEKIAQKNKNFRLYTYFSNEKGRLTSDFIINNSNLLNKEIFVCGPAPMMSKLKKDLIKAGIKKERIHIEEFQMI